ncbi:MAG: zinc ribbon domain-containing protein [Terriglobales bacterium]|jgi:hypothetical protein
MFCDACGNELQAGSSFCNRCGKSLSSPIVQSSRLGRLSEHIRLLGILWPALAALNGLHAGVLYILANTIFNPLVHPERPAFLHTLLSALALLMTLKAFAGFAAGWGLLQRESWARPVAVTLAFVSLFFDVPFGTALGIYTLWVLLPSEAERAYELQVRSATGRNVTSA